MNKTLWTSETESNIDGICFQADVNNQRMAHWSTSRTERGQRGQRGQRERGEKRHHWRRVVNVPFKGEMSAADKRRRRLRKDVTPKCVLHNRVAGQLYWRACAFEWASAAASLCGICGRQSSVTELSLSDYSLLYTRRSERKRERKKEKKGREKLWQRSKKGINDIRRRRTAGQQGERERTSANLAGWPSVPGTPGPIYYSLIHNKRCKANGLGRSYQSDETTTGRQQQQKQIVVVEVVEISRPLFQLFSISFYFFRFSPRSVRTMGFLLLRPPKLFLPHFPLCVDFIWFN